MHGGKIVQDGCDSLKMTMNNNSETVIKFDGIMYPVYESELVSAYEGATIDENVIIVSGSALQKKTKEIEKIKRVYFLLPSGDIQLTQMQGDHVENITLKRIP